MTTHIKVYPTKASALNAHHPVAGPPRAEGVDWPYDSFTCRRLSDGSFTEDAAKAYKPAAPEAATPADKADTSTAAQVSDSGKVLSASATLPPAAPAKSDAALADVKSK